MLPKTITMSMSEAREVIAMVRTAANIISREAQEVPHRCAKTIIGAIDEMDEELAARWGLGPIMGMCESCEELIFGEESYSSSDDGKLCEACCACYSDGDCLAKEGDA